MKGSSSKVKPLARILVEYLWTIEFLLNNILPPGLLSVIHASLMFTTVEN